MGSESECLRICTVTSHMGVVWVKQQIVYRESKWVYTSVVTRHVEIKGIMGCLVQIAMQIVD
jgi:hypothetical protein